MRKLKYAKRKQNQNMSKVLCRIIEKYIELLLAKDHELISILKELENLTDYEQKRYILNTLLTEDAEARVFEIISYAILKNHYKNIRVYFGYTKETIAEVRLELYKTGRTNANDGGIDFVMRPVGRFFQVTEVNNYDKYLLDIDIYYRLEMNMDIEEEEESSFITKSL